MLGSVIMVVFLVCYCCHRNMRKNRPHEYSQYWRAEPDVHSLEVFTMDSHAMVMSRRPARNQHRSPENRCAPLLFRARCAAADNSCSLRRISSLCKPVDGPMEINEVPGWVSLFSPPSAGGSIAGNKSAARLRMKLGLFMISRINNLAISAAARKKSTSHNPLVTSLDSIFSVRTLGLVRMLRINLERRPLN